MWTVSVFSLVSMQESHVAEIQNFIKGYKGSSAFYLAAWRYLTGESHKKWLKLKYITFTVSMSVRDTKLHLLHSVIKQMLHCWNSNVSALLRSAMLKQNGLRVLYIFWPFFQFLTAVEPPGCPLCGLVWIWSALLLFYRAVYHHFQVFLLSCLSGIEINSAL